MGASKAAKLAAMGVTINLFTGTLEDWRAPQRVGYAVPAGKRSHQKWKRQRASGRR